MKTSYRSRSGRALLAVLPLAAAAACGHGGAAAAAPSTTKTAPKAAPATFVQRAAAATARSFSGTYAVSSSAHTPVTARVWVVPHSYRVEVVAGGATAALFGSPLGTVACPGHPGQRTACYTVAAAGKAVPAEYDAGIQRIFTHDLPALAAGHALRATRVKPPGTVAATWTGVACYAVTAAASTKIDNGTYCLGTDGTPVQMRFTTGTLTLTRIGAAPTAAALRPPVHPRPLPAAG